MREDQPQTDQPSGAGTNRRRFLKGLGALSVVGLAGCGGDGDDGTDTSEDTPTETNDGMDETPTGTATGTDTPADTDTPTDTMATTPVFPDDPSALISVSGSPQVAPGETATVTGTIRNVYLFTVTGGEFALEAPSGDWTADAVSGTTFDSLDSQESQEVEWEVTAPEDAGGSFELSISGTYQGPDGGDTAEVSVTQSIVVRAPGEAPIGIDCGGGHYDEVPVIDGLPFLPTEDQRADIEFGSVNVQPVPEGDRWWLDGGNVTVDPAPNAATSDGVTEIDDTEADILYRSEWWAADEYTVTVNIENGTYDVVFHLAEIVFEDPETRVFGATVNGETAFEGVDLADEHGTGVATTRTLEGVEVTDGTVEIVLASSVENPKCSGIAIREA